MIRPKSQFSRGVRARPSHDTVYDFANFTLITLTYTMQFSTYHKDKFFSSSEQVFIMALLSKRTWKELEIENSCASHSIDYLRTFQAWQQSFVGHFALRWPKRALFLITTINFLKLFFIFSFKSKYCPYNFYYVCNIQTIFSIYIPIF